jgi:hypothetical protein
MANGTQSYRISVRLVVNDLILSDFQVLYCKLEKKPVSLNSWYCTYQTDSAVNNKADSVRDSLLIDNQLRNRLRNYYHSCLCLFSIVCCFCVQAMGF